MSTMVAVYLLTGLTAGAGFALVTFPLQLAVRWWLQHNETVPADPSPLASGPAAEALPADQGQELVIRLHEVALQMAREVGLHNDSLREVNTELGTVDPSNAGAAVDIVVSAVNKIAQANSRLSEQLHSAEETIREQSVMLESQMEDALTDALTEIANRRAFDHELSRRLADWQRNQTPMTLLLLDVDHFKRFNDEHGHQAGDEVLRGVARVLTETMRDMDLVSRYGGEEFAVVLPATEIEAGKLAAERARTAIAAETFHFDEAQLHVTVSLGVTQVSSGDDGAALISRADEALYASKHAGRKCAHYHDGTQCIRISTPSAEHSSRDLDRETIDESRMDSKLSAEYCPRTEEEILARASIASVDVDRAVPVVSPLATPGAGARPVDRLTGLPVLADMLEVLRRRLAEKDRHDTPLALVVFQLDDVERIVALGGRAPEFVVDTVTRILTAASRQMDLVVRSGRAEFAIMMPNCSQSDAIAPAERIRKAIAGCQKLKHSGSIVRFTVSVGVAGATDVDTATSLFERAETAACQAAARGANCTFVHNGDMCEPVLASVSV